MAASSAAFEAPCPPAGDAAFTGLLDRLEKKSFVKRVADAADGRKVRVSRSPSGSQCSSSTSSLS